MPDSIVESNYKKDNRYAPYCLGCSTMRRMEHAITGWRCSCCGAIQDSPAKKAQVPIRDKSHYRYNRGDHVVFHDDAQQEIRGIMRGLENYPDRAILLIELDDGEGWYHATLLKK